MAAGSGGPQVARRRQRTTGRDGRRWDRPAGALGARACRPRTAVGNRSPDGARAQHQPSRCGGRTLARSVQRIRHLAHRRPRRGRRRTRIRGQGTGVRRRAHQRHHRWAIPRSPRLQPNSGNGSQAERADLSTSRRTTAAGRRDVLLGPETLGGAHTWHGRLRLALRNILARTSFGGFRSVRPPARHYKSSWVISARDSRSISPESRKCSRR